MIRKLTKYIALKKNLNLSESGLQALRDKKVCALIQHAYHHVPYYRRLFDSIGLSPDDIRSVDDLHLIPISSKSDLLASGYDSLFSKNIDRSSLVRLNTSGTTGEPFSIYLTPKERQLRRLLDFRSLSAAGFRPSDHLVVLGPKIPFKKSIYHHFGIFNTDVIPPAEKVDEQIRQLKRFKPTWLWTYPSLIQALLESTDYQINEICQPKVIITSAEVFQPSMAASMERQLDYEHLNFYGALEFGRIAWECREHNGLHLNSDHVVLDVIHDEKRQFCDDQELGESVITNLDSYAMPIIRYRLGDLTSYVNQACDCGCAHPLITAPVGRVHDVISLPSGYARTPNGISHIMRDFKNIRKYQIVQHQLDYLVVNLIVNKNFSASLIDSLKQQILNFLGEPIKIEIKIVEAIDQQGSKYRYFISLIS